MPKIKHPDGDQTLDVSAADVDRYELAGWERQTDPKK